MSRFLWAIWPKFLICKPVIRGLRGLLTFPRNGWGPGTEAAQDVGEVIIDCVAFFEEGKVEGAGGGGGQHY